MLFLPYVLLLLYITEHHYVLAVINVGDSAGTAGNYEWAFQAKVLDK